MNSSKVASSIVTTLILLTVALGIASGPILEVWSISVKLSRLVQ